MNIDQVVQTFQEGFIITGLGMGFVFMFLTIMVFAMHGMKVVVDYINKVCPEVVADEKYTKKNTKNSNDEEVALAIALAVNAKNGGANGIPA